MVREDLKKKYMPRLKKRRGGIFRSDTRERLLGLKRPFGGRYPRNTRINFWNRVTEYVGTALIDLELFIETVETSVVNEVIDVDSIGPILDTYFQHDMGEFSEKDAVKAELARFLIIISFEYLKYPGITPIPDYENEKIKQALGVADSLVSKMIYNISNSTEGGSS